MPRNPSAITDSLSVDPALNQNANYRFGPDDRQYIDNQIRGIEQHIVDGLIRGRFATNFNAALTLTAGSVVCTAGIATLETQVTLATGVALASAGVGLGVAIRDAVAGGKVLVCTGGVLLRRSPSSRRTTRATCGSTRPRAPSSEWRR